MREIEITTISGVRVKLCRCDGHNVFDIRASSGKKLAFMGAVSPEYWPSLKAAIAAAEQVMCEAGWL